jgi:hypothetical protein
MGRLILAGTSEGAVPVARHAGGEFAARMLYAWSCELNYFVKEPRNAFEPDKPVLNGSVRPIRSFRDQTAGWATPAPTAIALAHSRAMRVRPSYWCPMRRIRCSICLRRAARRRGF